MGSFQIPTGVQNSGSGLPQQKTNNVVSNMANKHVVCLHREEQQERLAVMLLNDSIKIICVVGAQGSGRKTLIESMPDYFKACNLTYDFGKTVELYSVEEMESFLQSGTATNDQTLIVTASMITGHKGLYDKLSTARLVIVANESDLKNLTDAIPAQINYVAVPDMGFDETIDVINAKYPTGSVIIQSTAQSCVVNFKNNASILPQVYELSKTFTCGNPLASLQLLSGACHLMYKRMVTIDPLSVANGLLLMDANVREAHAQLLNLASSYNTHDSQVFHDVTAYIKGQDEAIDAVDKALIRRHILKSEKPLSMLFVGSSGNGKTELSKAIAKFLGAKFIRLNMAEYRGSDSLNKITGSSYGFVGSDTSNTLPLEPIITNPVSVVLLDEFEKACIEVKQFFMNALDEGYVQMAKGTIINCKSCIFIATSNAGYTTGQHRAGFKTDEIADDNNFLDEAAIAKNFSLELWNRFTKKIRFNDLSVDAISEILRDRWVITSQDAIDKGYSVPTDIPDDVLNAGLEEFETHKSEGARFVIEFINDKVVEYCM